MPTTSTIQQYTSTWQARLDQITDLTIRKRHLLQMMQNAGRITGPSGGRFVEWPLFAQANRPRGYGRSTPPNFQQPDNLRMPQLPWAAYHYGEELHVLDIEQNMGAEQFIDIVVNANNSVEKAFTQEWGFYLFQDGSSASEEMPMYGLKSAFKYYNVATATAAAPRQGYDGKVRLPSGTYAGYNTALATLGGSWSGQNGGSTYTSTAGGGTATFLWWPEGRGDAKYDAWSPLMVNTSSQGWNGSNVADTSVAFNTTFASQMLNFGIDYNSRLSVAGIKGQLDLILMATKNRLILQNYYEATQRTMTEVVMQPSDAGSIPSSSGMLDVAKPVGIHNGVFISTDYDIDDPDLMIGINMMGVEYRTVHSNSPTSGRTRIMVPYKGEIPGGAGQMIGGRSHGQFIINSPKKLTFWYPFGNYTTD